MLGGNQGCDYSNQLKQTKGQGGAFPIFLGFRRSRDFFGHSISFVFLIITSVIPLCIGRLLHIFTQLKSKSHCMEVVRVSRR